jgi:hypothetical protein
MWLFEMVVKWKLRISDGMKLSSTATFSSPLSNRISEAVKPDPAMVVQQAALYGVAAPGAQGHPNREVSENRLSAMF